MANNNDRSRNIAKISFENAMSKKSKTLKSENNTIEELISEIEKTSQFDEDGNEFWYGRDLAVLLEYRRWDNFLSVVAKAKNSCSEASHDVDNHFADVSKMVRLGSGAEREIDDLVLSRYAAYLIAQNGDSRKRAVAFAQTYFAIQTRRQEIRDQEDQEYENLTEDERRAMLREELKNHNKQLASAAKGAGVNEGIDYAIFQTEGYKGLYGGLDVPGIRRRKCLGKRKAILDHMGSTELAANLFRATQTEEKLRRENIKGKQHANRAHFEVGSKVRQTIKDIGGTMPEVLPVAEDINKVKRRLKRQEKDDGKIE